MKSVYYTFYNSKFDIDYSIYTKDFPNLIIFYCYKSPKNIFGTADLIDVNSSLKSFNENDFILSRLIKFQPWRFIDDNFDNYIYFDFRIKLSKKFINMSSKLKNTCFFNHREGGVLKDELLRVICRNKINLENLNLFLDDFSNKLDLPITENGVLVLTKKISLSFKKMEPWFELINRDQILTPIFLENQKINYFDFNLSNLSFFYVRPKKLNFINYLKLLYSEILFTFVRYRERFKQC